MATNYLNKKEGKDAVRVQVNDFKPTKDWIV